MLFALLNFNHFYVRRDLRDALLAFGDEHVTDTATGQRKRRGTRNNTTSAIAFGVHFWVQKGRI